MIYTVNMKYIFDNVAVGVFCRPISKNPRPYIEIRPVSDGEVIYANNARIKLSVEECEELIEVLARECQRIQDRDG